MLWERSRAQNEADAADVANDGGLICPVDLSTQTAHMNIHEVRFRNELVVPDLLEESCPRQQLAIPLHHVFEQPKLTRPQIDLTIAALRSAIEEIELQRSDPQHRFIRRGRQPDQGFSARYFNYRVRLF